MSSVGNNPLFLMLAVYALCAGGYVSAQVKALDIAQRYPVADESLQFGDIIIYDREALTYRLSERHADDRVFGVAVESPILMLDDGTQNVPVVRNGETFLNVTAQSGPIAVGDYLTASDILGKAERASAKDTYIVGIAQGAYAELEGEIVGKTGEISFGQIPVLLSIGDISKAQELLTGRGDLSGGVSEATLLNVIQYIVAAFIAVGSVFIAFRNFGPNIKTGIDSIGRNPLAKASIQSMMILNIVLIVLISGGGLVISLAVLLLPI